MLLDKRALVQPLITYCLFYLDWHFVLLTKIQWGTLAGTILFPSGVRGRLAQLARNNVALKIWKISSNQQEKSTETCYLSMKYRQVAAFWVCENEGWFIYFRRLCSQLPRPQQQTRHWENRASYAPWMGRLCHLCLTNRTRRRVRCWHWRHICCHHGGLAAERIPSAAYDLYRWIRSRQEQAEMTISQWRHVQLQGESLRTSTFDTHCKILMPHRNIPETGHAKVISQEVSELTFTWSWCNIKRQNGGLHFLCPLPACLSSAHWFASSLSDGLLNANMPRTPCRGWWRAV